VALTEMQTLVLWALFAKPDGASFQKDIRPEVTKPDREALVKAGLITSEKRGGSGLWLEVTDKGWAWAAEHLDADLPKRSTAGSAILQAWLGRLKDFMKARGFVLADILGAQPSIGILQQQPQKTSHPPLPEPPQRAPLDHAAVRERIRNAYLELTGSRFNTRALLKDIRANLNDIDRATLDETLKKMHLEEGTTLSGLNNPQELTEAIRDAGLVFKGEPMYVLWITK
jgi:hypothetical protein